MAIRQKTRHFRHRASLRVTEPTIEPVTTIDLKAHLKLWEDDKDRYLTDLIKEARTEFEDLTNIALITQQRKLVLDSWTGKPDPWWDGVREMATTELVGSHDRHIEVPVFPLQSVDTVTVYDTSSNSTSVTVADVFDVDTASKPPRLTLQFGATWPIATRANNAIEIVYTAGYGDDVSDIPAPLVRAVRQMAGYLYNHRGAGCTSAELFKESGAESIARTYGLTRI